MIAAVPGWLGSVAGSAGLSRLDSQDLAYGLAGLPSSFGIVLALMLLASRRLDPPPFRFDVSLSARRWRLACRAFCPLQVSLETGAGAARRLNGRL